MPFEDALAIAKENGGSEFLLQYEDDCSIDIALKGKRSGRNYWEIQYKGPDRQSSEDYLELSINAKTGAVQ